MADDIFTQETVDKLNASALTFNEVVTSRTGGVSSGAIIDQTLTPLGETTDTLKGRLDKLGVYVSNWSSADGGTLTSPVQAFLNNTSGSVGFGNYYSWSGAFPKTVAPGTDPAAVGSGYTPRTDVALREDLASPTGSSLVWYKQTTLASLMDSSPSPLAFGAPANGVDDDSAAIMACLAFSKCIDMRNRTWKINSTIDLPDGCDIDIRGANIIANTGSNPLFTFNGRAEGLSMLGGTGVVTGTAAAFLRCTGLSNTPVNADFVKMVRLYGVHVSSTTIDKALDFVNAVRQVFIDSCFFSTKNGISAHGKCVEIAVNKTIIYGSTEDTGTYAVWLESEGGGIFYHEGWLFTNCTIDHFQRCFRVMDCFVLTLDGGYVANAGYTSDPKSYTFDIGGGTTSLCSVFKINAELGGPVTFAATVAGKTYIADINAIFVGITGRTIINIGVNACDIDMSGSSFKNCPSCFVATVANNCNTIKLDDMTADATLSAGVLVNGSNGGDISVRDFTYQGSGSAIYAERPITIKGIPGNVSGSNTIEYIRKNNTNDLTGTYAVGSDIASVTMDVAKGMTGVITIGLPVSGANAATQILGVSVPSGIKIPDGSGWSSGFIRVMNASEHVSRTIPFYATADVKDGVFKVYNQAGNSVSVAFGGFLSVQLDV